MNKRKVFTIGTSMVLMGGAGLGLVGLLVLPGMVRTQLDAAIQTAEADLGVEIELGAVDASVLRHFPRVSLTISDVVIRNKLAPFEDVELFKAGTLTVAVDAKSVFSEKLEVRTVHVSDGSVDLRAAEDTANWELGSSSDSDDSSAGLDVQLDDIQLSNVDLRWSDAEGTFARASAITFAGKGKVEVDSMKFVTDTTAVVSAGTPGSSYLRDLKITGKGPVSYGTNDGKITLGGLALELGTLALTLDGHAVPSGEGWDTEMALDAPSATFGSVLSLLPPGTVAKGLKTAGNFTLKGTVAGHYEGDTLPGGSLQLGVSGASVDSSDGSISGLSFSSQITRKDGPWQSTKVVLSDGKMTVAKSPATWSLTALPPLDDPTVDLAAKGRVNLAAIDSILGLGMGLAGDLDTDIKAKGKASAFSAENPGNASGHIRGKGLSFPLDGFPDLITIANLDMGLSAQAVDIKTMDVRTGPTDVSVTGTLEQALGWSLGTANLGGRLEVKGNTIDLRTLAEDDAASSDDAAVIVSVPEDMDLSVGVALGQVYQGDYHLKDVKGDVSVKNGTMALSPLSFNTMGGSVRLNGSYEAPSTNFADVDMKVTFSSLDMNKVMKTMDVASGAIPAAKDSGGTLGGTVELNTRLKPDTSPDLDSLFSKGLVLSVGSSISPAVLKELGDKLGSPKLASLDTSKTEFDYVVEKGKLTFKPVPVKLGSTPATFNGSAGIIDQTVDLGLTFAVATKGLAATGIKIPKAASKLDVTAKISGPYNKPKLGVQIAGVDDIVDAVKEEVVERVKGEVNKWIDIAEKEGDKLIAEAEKAAAALRSEASKAAGKLISTAKKESKKLENEAKNPVAKGIAAKAGDVLVKEAEKAANKLEREADKKGDDLVSAAKKQKTKLVADARARTD